MSRQRFTLPSGLPAIEVVQHLGTETVGKSRKVFVNAAGGFFWIDAETYLHNWGAVEPSFSQIINSFAVRETVTARPESPGAELSARAGQARPGPPAEDMRAALGPSWLVSRFPNGLLGLEP